MSPARQTTTDSRHPKYRSSPRCVALLIALLATSAAFALESDRRQPIELAADSVDIDEGKGVSIYKGDVDLRQGTIHLQADIVTVHQQGRKTSKIVADGSPVQFQQQSDKGLVQGRAKHVEYEVDSENLVLSGDAEVVQGQDRMRSDRIVYDRVRSVVKAGAAAQGKQRVKISIQAPGQ